MLCLLFFEGFDVALFGDVLTHSKVAAVPVSAFALYPVLCCKVSG